MHTDLTSDTALMAALFAAGWAEPNAFDTPACIDALRADDYTVTEAAVETLERFGGQTLEPQPANAQFWSGTIIFDPLYAASGEAERIQLREAALGVKLCPVAEWCNEYIVLAASDGSFFAETSFQMLWLGSNLRAALHTIMLADSQPTDIWPPRTAEPLWVPGTPGP